MSNQIGIDIGNSVITIATLNDGNPTVIPNQDGDRHTPHVIAYANGQILIGKKAQNQALLNASQTVYNLKRLFCQNFGNLGNLSAYGSYAIVADNEGKAAVSLDNRIFAPQELTAQILHALKSSAENQLGKPITQAVIAIPAYYNDTQREITKQAAQIAGLEVLHLIPEPNAAALANGFDNLRKGNIAVYDFGGSTFNISILEITDGIMEILSTNGVDHIGAKDILNAITQYIINRVYDTQNFNLKTLDKSYFLSAMQRIYNEAENAVKALNNMAAYEINLPYLAQTNGKSVHYVDILHKSKLEELALPFVEKTIVPCKTAMDDARIKPSDICDILLVGATTLMPLVQEIVYKIFWKKPTISVNPADTVAIGAAIQANRLAGDTRHIYDPYKLTSFVITDRYTIQITFDDGMVQVVDFEPLLCGEAWRSLSDLTFFNQVSIDPTTYTLTWPNGLDFDLQILYNWPDYKDTLAAIAQE